MVFKTKWKASVLGQTCLFDHLTVILSSIRKLNVILFLLQIFLWLKFLNTWFWTVNFEFKNWWKIHFRKPSNLNQNSEKKCERQIALCPLSSSERIFFGFQIWRMENLDIWFPIKKWKTSCINLPIMCRVFFSLFSLCFSSKL